MKILDCTLRDGGYYTNWDFERTLVDDYIESFNHLPVDFLEIGYRSVRKPGTYLGEYFYLPLGTMQRIREQSKKQLVVIINEKDVQPEQVKTMLQPCVGIIDMVRIAVNPARMKNGLLLAEQVKAMGFITCINAMYMSSWKDQADFLKLLPEMDHLADYFYMVDSYGGVYPDDVLSIYELVRNKTSVALGFHGHNNLELAFMNTLTAIYCGVDIVDATVCGMGRGAGNLRTELLLAALNSKGQVKFDYNHLSKVVDGFSKLHERYNWGTNLPYIFSGANSLPQKDVMDWVSKRYYSFNSIMRALNNQLAVGEERHNLPKFPIDGTPTSEDVLIIGGGASAIMHEEAVKLFLKSKPQMIVVHASSKNAMTYKEIANTQIFCLVGNEGLRMEEVFSGDLPLSSISVLPPSPRKMGTYIPKNLVQKACELSAIDFTPKYLDSHTTVALQTALNLGATNIYLVGYDGYDSGEVANKDHELFIENEYLFTEVQKKAVKVTSLTATKYNSLTQDSIFALI